MHVGNSHSQETQPPHTQNVEMKREQIFID